MSEPAFPMAAGPEPRVNESTHYNEGMSLRDWFAGMALQGLLANPAQVRHMGATNVVTVAWDLADTMLDKRREWMEGD